MIQDHMPYDFHFDQVVDNLFHSCIFLHFYVLMKVSHRILLAISSKDGRHGVV